MGPPPAPPTAPSSLRQMSRYPTASGPLRLDGGLGWSLRRSRTHAAISRGSKRVAEPTSIPWATTAYFAGQDLGATNATMPFAKFGATSSKKSVATPDSKLLSKNYPGAHSKRLFLMCGSTAYQICRISLLT